jgi:hypothetical protein
MGERECVCVREREREGGTKNNLVVLMVGVGSVLKSNCLISRLVSFSVSREVLTSRLGLVSV